MATRSTISLEFADGTIGQVYCHWDGYLSNNGKILQEYYSNPFVLRDLIDLGGLSSLRPTIGIKHPFSHYDVDGMTVVEYANLYRDMCVFYGRDRGEGQSDATYFKDYDHFLVDGQREEYDYILRNVNGVATWFVSDHGADFVTLESAIMDEEDRIAQDETDEVAY
jgi:hypothetical protein